MSREGMLELVLVYAAGEYCSFPISLEKAYEIAVERDNDTALTLKESVNGW